MMEERRHGRGHRPALQDLDAPLRDAVEHLLDEPVPQQAAERAVDRYVALGDRRAERRFPGRLRLAGAVATAAAAALLTVLVLQNRGREERAKPAVDVASLPSDREESAEEPLTLQKCRLALHESPEAMVRLLDQHASTFFPSSGEPLRIGPRGWRDLVEHEIGEDF